MASRPMNHFLEIRGRNDRCAQTFVEILERRPEGEAHEMMARGVEEVAAVGGVDVEEDTRDDDGLFFQQLLEEGL